MTFIIRYRFLKTRLSFFSLSFFLIIINSTGDRRRRAPLRGSAIVRGNASGHGSHRFVSLFCFFVIPDCVRKHHTGAKNLYYTLRSSREKEIVRGEEKGRQKRVRIKLTCVLKCHQEERMYLETR